MVEGLVVMKTTCMARRAPLGRVTRQGLWGCTKEVLHWSSRSSLAGRSGYASPSLMMSLAKEVLMMWVAACASITKAAPPLTISLPVSNVSSRATQLICKRWRWQAHNADEVRPSQMTHGQCRRCMDDAWGGARDMESIQTLWTTCGRHRKK